MRLFNRQDERERLFETVNDSVEAVVGGWTKGKMLKAGVIAGGLAGLTAASAGISSLRRRQEGRSDGS
jgi:hypothetical protein